MKVLSSLCYEQLHLSLRILAGAFSAGYFGYGKYNRRQCRHGHREDRREPVFSGV